MREGIFEISDYHASEKFKPSARPKKRQILPGGGGTSTIRFVEIVTPGWLIGLMVAIKKLQLTRVSLLFALKFEIQCRFQLAKDIFHPFIQRIIYEKQESQRTHEIILPKARSKRGRKFTNCKNKNNVTVFMQTVALVRPGIDDSRWEPFLYIHASLLYAALPYLRTFISF